MSSMSLAVSADGVNNILRKMAARSTKTIPAGKWTKLGPLRVRLDGAAGHAEVKRNTFRVVDGPVGGPRGHLSELDWIWDQLRVGVGLDIPTVTVGGWCLLPTPWGCAVRAPKKQFFKGDPDISASINLAGLRHEVSASFSIEGRRDPANHVYGLYAKPEMPIDVDVIDIADIAGDLLDRLVRKIVDDLLGWLPSWARSVVDAILGGIAKLVRSILDFADDLGEWISRTVGVSLGLFNLLISIVVELFFQPRPIFELDDPYIVLEKESGQPEVALPVKAVKAVFSEAEQSLDILVSF